jgi:hypothetical protein
MANINVSLSGTISSLDTAANSTIMSRALSLLFGATTLFFEPFFQAASGGSTVNLPAATVRVVMVINKSASANLTVSYTPSGGGSTSILLEPGEMFLYFQTGTAAGGITALSVTAASGTIPAEVLAAA